MRATRRTRCTPRPVRPSARSGMTTAEPALASHPQNAQGPASCRGQSRLTEARGFEHVLGGHLPRAGQVGDRAARVRRKPSVGHSPMPGSCRTYVVHITDYVRKSGRPATIRSHCAGRAPPGTQRLKRRCGGVAGPGISLGCGAPPPFTSSLSSIARPSSGPGPESGKERYRPPTQRVSRTLRRGRQSCPFLCEDFLIQVGPGLGEHVPGAEAGTRTRKPFAGGRS